MTEINGVSLPFLPAGGIKELGREHVRTQTDNNSVSFKEVFEDELNKIKFSSHAQTRMESREIDMNQSDFLRLENAFEKAQTKGANESLILMDEKAFIVSVPNKTVITVVDKAQASDTVFTNIDSAVIA